MLHFPLRIRICPRKLCPIIPGFSLIRNSDAYEICRKSCMFRRLESGQGSRRPIQSTNIRKYLTQSIVHRTLMPKLLHWPCYGYTHSMRIKLWEMRICIIHTGWGVNSILTMPGFFRATYPLFCLYLCKYYFAIFLSETPGHERPVSLCIWPISLFCLVSKGWEARTGNLP